MAGYPRDLSDMNRDKIRFVFQKIFPRHGHEKKDVRAKVRAGTRATV